MSSLRVTSPYCSAARLSISLRGVDFYVGDSGEPYCDSDSGIVEPTAREALRNILKDPMARIAERVPGVWRGLPRFRPEHRVHLRSGRFDAGRGRAGLD